ncbi:MAG: hypothetical protein ACT4OK_18570 [Gemmobacter sp.]
MLIKIVALFLVAMAVLAFFGRLRLGWFRLPPDKRRAAPRMAAPVVCIRCGTPIPGPGNCPCGAARPGKG